VTASGEPAPVPIFGTPTTLFPGSPHRERGGPDAGPARDSGPGLARRVPGTHLSPALRRDTATPDPGGDGSTPERDPERVRSMLSRFQASQRAGRAAATHPPGSPQEGR
jgi:hypothetical protein